MVLGDAKQAIKDTIDIVDLVSRYTNLIPAGKRMKGLSPFTNEKTPSFFVDQEEGVYYCFSSQKGGDIFTFVQEMEGVDFKGALQLLAEQAGIDIAGTGQQQNRNSGLYHVLEAAKTAYQTHLSREKEVLDYLKRRGIEEVSIDKWEIGYAPNAWNTLYNKQTANLETCIEAGMCVKKEERVYDRFRNRIQFPFFDTSNRVIGFSGRAYNDEETAKYINSPESPLFDKSSFIYGLHIAKPHIRRTDAAMLTEGPIDAIMAHQAGYPIAVATSGTAVTEAHLQTLQRLSNNLLIALDADKAGIRAALRVIEIATALGMQIKVIVLPEGEDPADVIVKDKEQFKSAVKEAKPFVPFITEHIQREYGKTGEDLIRGVRKEVFPILLKMREPMMQERIIHEIAGFCKIGAEAIKESLRQLKAAIPQKPQEQLQRVQRSASQAEKEKDRIEELVKTIATATAFLGKKLKEKEKQIIEEIQKIQKLPRVEKKIARMRYEEEFSDKEKREEQVQMVLKEAIGKLLPELRKKEAYQRLRQWEKEKK